MRDLAVEIGRRRTFAIISHPDAGKTTLTEKLLLFGGAIRLAGTIKGRKSTRQATSDWMKLEQQRGVSVTTSVMQFPYCDRIINLLDTPGHEDFSEDTYRTLTAVDSALMVIDASKGVEPRTIKLMEVCRMRDTPIVTFINKLDREVRDPLELLDEIEQILKIRCAPITWPIGMGRQFQGVYHLLKGRFYLYSGPKDRVGNIESVDDLNAPGIAARLGESCQTALEEIELIGAAGTNFNLEDYRAGHVTPVFFGSAINNFGIQELLDAFIEWAPPPQQRSAEPHPVIPAASTFSGFCFKIQANMDPRHRDRVAFIRVCSGVYRRGMNLHSVRLNVIVRVSHALTFMARDRELVEEAYPGDIIGLHNHGTIALGDSFTEGEVLHFTGIPNFAPDHFRRLILCDPLKAKQLNKGLNQLCEEGATQVYRPLVNNDIVLGAVGLLQFDVVAYRLRDEYRVEFRFQPVDTKIARWIIAEDPKQLDDFKTKNARRVAIDHFGSLIYLASSSSMLSIAEEHWPGIRFLDSREQHDRQRAR